MIRDIRPFDKESLLGWLRNEAGVNHHEWFGTGLFQGNLEIQQVPEEYVEYLWFLKEGRFKSYLNIGIGKGGSFLTETYIQPDLEISVAVDNSSYWQGDQKSSIQEKMEWLRSNAECEVEFHDSDSVEWLKSNSFRKFDVIFIDGDHSYEGVKRDFENSLPLLSEGGSVIFHDINSRGCEGVVRFWNEIKNDACVQFVSSQTCGIGIWKSA
jgi:spermidine synthase